MPNPRSKNDLKKPTTVKVVDEHLGPITVSSKPQPPVKTMPAAEVVKEKPKKPQQPYFFRLPDGARMTAEFETMKMRWVGQLVVPGCQLYTATASGIYKLFDILGRKWAVQNDPNCPQAWKTMPQYQTEAAK